jgi:hypothetical protein
MEELMCDAMAEASLEWLMSGGPISCLGLSGGCFFLKRVVTMANRFMKNMHQPMYMLKKKNSSDSRRAYSSDCRKNDVINLLVQEFQVRVLCLCCWPKKKRWTSNWQTLRMSDGRRCGHPKIQRFVRIIRTNIDLYHK